MKIYTLTGDDGTTSLVGGKRVSKDSLRVEAYGSVDELIAWIGLLRDHKENSERKDLLINIQGQLMLCATILANDSENKNIRKLSLDPEAVTVIEKEIDKISKTLPALKNFVLPGGHILVSYCHVARCVCRRAERIVVRLGKTEEVPLLVYKFLNRLSDYLFILSRKLVLDLGIEEVKWKI